MRVNLACGFDPAGEGVPQKTAELLESRLEAMDGITLASEGANVLHVVGAWNPATAALARKAAREAVPYVHTPLGTLAPWNKPTAAHLRLTAGAGAVAASGKMEERLLEKQNAGRLRLIPDALLTSTTNPEETAAAYAGLYRELVRENDAALRRDVEAKLQLLSQTDDCTLGLCRDLLYARCLYRQRNIPRNFLSGLVRRLTAADFDEDRFAEVLSLISLYDFTARMEHVMAEEAGLTEGFMPVPALGDKQARDIMSTVTDDAETDEN